MSENHSNITSKSDSILDFDEFRGASLKAWKAEVERLLKGASFEKKMITKTYEGLELQPIYRREDVKNLAFVDSIPGQPPFTRSAETAGYNIKPWDISQKLPYPTVESINTALVKDLNAGQTAISIKLDKASRRFVDPDTAENGEVGRNGTSIATVEDIEKLLTGIDIKATPIHLQAGASSLPLLSLLFGYMKRHKYGFDDLSGSIKADPIGELAALGELPIDIETALNEMARIVNWLDSNSLKVRTVAIDASIYHNSGGSAVEELAYSMATGVEYLRQMEKRDIPINETAKQMVFIYSVGSNFFTEIAKFRAARMLWSKVIHDCGGDETAQKMTIHSKTSFYNKSTYDPYVNLLRATTEAFSAVAGGCDSLHVGFFDDTYKQPDEFSRRIARSIQIILKEESHLDKIIDPAGGSWYLENLTGMLANKAWDSFREIEKSGGIIEALISGVPQKRIEEINNQRLSNIARRKDVFVGTNMHANLAEKPSERQTPDYAAIYEQRNREIESFRNSIDKDNKSESIERLYESVSGEDNNFVEKAIDAAASGATLGEIAKTIRKNVSKGITIYPLRIHRGPELFEVLRGSVERYESETGIPIKVTLACFGRLSEYKAREDFSAGFFQAGGFKTETLAVKDNDGAADEINISKSPIVVLCSSDDSYQEIVPSFCESMKKINSDTTLVLAGYPKDKIEEYRKAGIDEFIYMGANVYEMLVKLSKKIGVRS